MSRDKEEKLGLAPLELDDPAHLEREIEFTPGTGRSSMEGYKEKPQKLFELKPRRSTGVVRLSDILKQPIVKKFTAICLLLFPLSTFVYLLHQTYLTDKNIRYIPDLPNGRQEGAESDLNITFYDLNDYHTTPEAWQRNEKILFLVPLRDASAHLPMFFSHMHNLSYPHNLIDLSFLVSDSKDQTMEDLIEFLTECQSNKDKSQRFGRIEIYEKDFGQAIGQGFSDRHGFAAQGPRRKLMARARNWLLSTALKPDHSWVYWRDADVETVPATILEDLIHHDRDVIVPNVWRPLPDWLGNQQPYDLNSWQESEGGLDLAETLDEDAVIVEGYVEYATWRPHLAYLRDPYGDPETEMELDGIGGVSIMAKARVFRDGAHFPAFSFEKHAETEGFGKMCRRMGKEVIGLPHYTIWHIYEPSSDDIKHIEWMAEEEIKRTEWEANRQVYEKAWNNLFEDRQEDWRSEKKRAMKNTENIKGRTVVVDWSGQDDEYYLEVDESKPKETQSQDPRKITDPRSFFRTEKNSGDVRIDITPYEKFISNRERIMAEKGVTHTYDKDKYKLVKWTSPDSAPLVIDRLPEGYENVG